MSTPDRILPELTDTDIGHLVGALRDWTSRLNSKGYRLGAIQVAALMDRVRDAPKTADYDKQRHEQAIADTPALTVREVMNELGRSHRTVQRYLASGELCSTRIGGRRLVSRADLAAFQAGER